MHGEIKLESTLNMGTTASFWIPFNKAQFEGNTPTARNIQNLPDRLQSELSLSCDTSNDDFPHLSTPPLSQAHDRGGQERATVPATAKELFGSDSAPASVELSDEERGKTHVLVVEDK